MTKLLNTKEIIKLFSEIPNNLEQDLENIAVKNSLIADETVGMKYNIFSNKWYKSSDTSVNYISTFLKN